ncbi:MAG: hypothetical protein ABI634_11330 [Acidobacteriota bacterium]
MIPEVWIVRIVGIGGLMWCIQMFVHPQAPLRGRPVGQMFVRHSRLSAVVVGAIFAAMLILSFR